MLLGLVIIYYEIKSRFVYNLVVIIINAKAKFIFMTDNLKTKLDLSLNDFESSDNSK